MAYLHGLSHSLVVTQAIREQQRSRRSGGVVVGCLCGPFEVVVPAWLACAELRQTELQQEVGIPVGRWRLGYGPAEVGRRRLWGAPGRRLPGCGAQLFDRPEVARGGGGQQMLSDAGRAGVSLRPATWRRARAPRSGRPPRCPGRQRRGGVGGRSQWSLVQHAGPHQQIAALAASGSASPPSRAAWSSSARSRMATARARRAASGPRRARRSSAHRPKVAVATSRTFPAEEATGAMRFSRKASTSVWTRNGVPPLPPSGPRRRRGRAPPPSHPPPASPPRQR